MANRDAAVSDIVVTPDTFDASRVQFGNPETVEFNKGQIKFTRSSIRYSDPKTGKTGYLSFALPPSSTFGVTINHKASVPEEKRNDESREGYSVAYQVTSRDTATKPSASEQTIINAFESLHEAVCTFVLNNKAKLPPQSRAMVNTDGVGAIKPLLEKAVPNKKDPTKMNGARVYLKLVTQGKGKDIRVLTPFYTPGNKLENPAGFVDVRGRIEPVVRIERIYFGNHGTESPYCASLKGEVIEANFIPQVPHDLPRNRLLGPNTAEPASASPTSPDYSGDGDFQESSSPIEDLSKIKPVTRPAPSAARSKGQAQSAATPAARGRGGAQRGGGRASRPAPPPIEDDEDVEE